MLYEDRIERSHLPGGKRAADVLGVEISLPSFDDPLECRTKDRIIECKIEKSFTAVEEGSQG